jgi:8-oxo-dGTP pyrophosphatase MutT (NUDIX family)
MPIRVRGVAAALIVRPSARILILQRNKPTSRGLWSLLMGGIEVSETAGQAIRREIAEELGVHGGEIYAAGCCDTYYNHVAEAIEIMPVFAVLFNHFFLGEQVYLQQIIGGSLILLGVQYVRRS